MQTEPSYAREPTLKRATESLAHQRITRKSEARVRHFRACGLADSASYRIPVQRRDAAARLRRHSPLSESEKYLRFSHKKAGRAAGSRRLQRFVRCVRVH